MSSLFDSQRYTLLWLFKGRWLALVQPWPGTIWASPGHPAKARPSGQPAARPHANSNPAIRPRPRPSGQPATRPHANSHRPHAGRPAMATATRPAGHPDHMQTTRPPHPATAIRPRPPGHGPATATHEKNLSSVRYGRMWPIWFGELTQP